eukprot:1158408-Pelagomonas_calceolata.AAC.8
MVALWALRLQPVPKVDKGFLIALLPVALFHVIGHVSACLSFSQMAVSFAHIVKSAEPVRVLDSESEELELLLVPSSDELRMRVGKCLHLLVKLKTAVCILLTAHLEQSWRVG